MGKPIVGRLRAAPLPAPLRRELTAETSQNAGGQDSLLSDAAFLLALVDQRHSPPRAACHVLTKRITDKSVGADCSGSLSTSPSPPPRVQAAQLATQKRSISFGNEKDAVGLELHTWR